MKILCSVVLNIQKLYDTNFVDITKTLSLVLQK
jgi:hypothetical protein